MVRCTFSPPWAWRPAVGARLARTLGSTTNLSLLHMPKITFTSYDGASYQFLPKGGFSTQDCCGYDNGKHVCTFETMSLSSNKLHVEHFAVSKPMIGKGYGESCLRHFAALVKVQMPYVCEITFDLGRSLTGSDISRLAQARKVLFENVGAVDICIRQCNTSSKVVGAAWKQQAW